MAVLQTNMRVFYFTIFFKDINSFFTLNICKDKAIAHSNIGSRKLCIRGNNSKVNYIKTGRRVCQFSSINTLRTLHVPNTLFITEDNISSPLHSCFASWQLYSFIHLRHISQKKSHNFRRVPLSSILYIDFFIFSENEDKELKLDPILFQSC